MLLRHQVVYARQCERMLMPSTVLLQPLHLSPYLFCPVVLALFPQHLSQVDHARRDAPCPAPSPSASVPDATSLLPACTCSDPSAPPPGCSCSSVCQDGPCPTPSPQSQCLKLHLFCLLVLTLKLSNPALNDQSTCSGSFSLDLGCTLLTSTFLRSASVAYRRQLCHL
jgi:hypothetical protein